MNQCFLGPSYKGVNVQNLTTGLSNIRLENGICVGTDVEDGHKTKGLAYSLNYPSTKHGVKPDGMSVDYCDDGLCPVPHRPNHYPTFPAAYEAYTHSRNFVSKKVWYGFCVRVHQDKQVESLDGANPRNVTVLHKLAYQGLGLPRSSVQIIQGKKEEVDPSQLQIPPGGFEGIFFSPRYYNRERYYGADQSHVVYPNYNAWREGFYGPLFRLCAKVIDPKKGRMAVVVSDQTVGGDFYPLVFDTILMASKAGFRFTGYRYLTIAGARKAKRLSKESYEVLCLFSK